MAVILGIDHGTTRTKAVAFDEHFRPVGSSAVELPQRFPQPGWVEHDPLEILAVTEAAVRKCLAACRLDGRDIAGIGLANQGETVVIWDRRTGAPVYNAIVWQDRRTTDACEQLVRDGHAEWIHARTGVHVDPYFSATKLRWILDAIPNGQTRAEAGDLLAGTTDSWLIWNLSDRASHLTDASTASRTMLFDLQTLDWNDDLLRLFRIPRRMLPEVRASAGPAAEIGRGLFGRPVTLAGLAVDQQAALFAHGCFAPGEVKVTYGTGAFILMTVGDRPVLSRSRLITTVAWRLPDQVTYALDGGVFTAGAAVQWLRDGLRMITSIDESGHLAAMAPDTAGVVVVPALAGLAAPHWSPRARGAVFGLTGHTTRAHFARAILEGIAHSICDVMDAMVGDAGWPVREIKVDGGPTRNPVLMQAQADLLGITLDVSDIMESTAAGAAGLAGLALGWWTHDDIRSARRSLRRVEPSLADVDRAARRAVWADAVRLVREWRGS